MRADIADALGVDEPGPGQSFPYDAFISYDHDDRPVAHGLQRGLHRIGRRVGQLRALRVRANSGTCVYGWCTACDTNQPTASPPGVYAAQQSALRPGRVLNRYDVSQLGECAELE
jgi:hypothetical protein